jgi:hypothetical protein
LRAVGGLSIAVSIAFAAAPAHAFHSGGVGACEGCHSMHGSLRGEPMVTGAAAGEGSGRYLLRAADPTGACLHCHATAETVPSSYHVATLLPPEGIPAQRTPGGDFAWLRQGWKNTGRTGLVHAPDPRHGHNVVSGDYAFPADPDLSTAPGGAYPAASLHCTSCHDPHGQYRRLADGSFATTGLPIFASGSYHDSPEPLPDVSAAGAYRLLGGAGYAPAWLAGDHAFVADPPDAVSPASYNRDEPTQEAQTFVAYGRRSSEWCANCHPAFLSNGYTSGMAGLRHPAGERARLTAAVVEAYNAYVTSGVMTNADPARAYSTLAPFEVGTGDYAALKARASASGAIDRSASASANVACLSCHRAHAGGFDALLRFSLGPDFELITEPDPAGAPQYLASGIDDKLGVPGYTQELTQAAYYGRPASWFGSFARVYCNKCHAQD